MGCAPSLLGDENPDKNYKGEEQYQQAQSMVRIYIANPIYIIFQPHGKLSFFFWESLETITGFRC